jgi:hypothetical protein
MSVSTQHVVELKNIGSDSSHVRSSYSSDLYVLGLSTQLNPKRLGLSTPQTYMYLDLTCS